jgi:hypothetical protein
MLGQINLGTTAGDIIYNISKKEDVKNIVEIGTWNGMGSTLCVIKAVKESNISKNFISIELYPDMFNTANNNLKEDISYVKLLNGRIIDHNDIYWFDHSTIDFNTDTHASLWYEKDIKLLTESENVLYQLPEKIDFLILDGGEYTTYPEWVVLKSRTKIVALDDSNILKTSRVRKEILESGEYITIHDDLLDRNGFSVFEKIKK